MELKVYEMQCVCVPTAYLMRSLQPSLSIAATLDVYDVSSQAPVLMMPICPELLRECCISGA